jgi:hypothetical protein
LTGQGQRHEVGRVKLCWRAVWHACIAAVLATWGTADAALLAKLRYCRTQRCCRCGITGDSEVLSTQRCCRCGIIGDSEVLSTQRCCRCGITGDSEVLSTQRCCRCGITGDAEVLSTRDAKKGGIPQDLRSFGMPPFQLF